MIKISGNSMLPRYHHGDYILVLRFLIKPLAVGDFVIADHRNYGLLFKRIRKIKSEHIWLEGLNNNSLNTDVLGQIPRSAVLGRVVWHISHHLSAAQSA